MKIELCNSFQITGDDYASFCDAVESMSKQTACIVYNTTQIGLLSLDAETDESYQFYDHRVKRIRNLQKAKFAEKGIPDDIKREMEREKLMLILRASDGITVHFVAPSVINMLGERVGIKGDCMNRPSLKRDAFVSELKDALKKQSLSVVIRKCDGTTKAFAVHSKDYPYVPQTVLRDIVDVISEDKEAEMGTVAVKHWDMSHSITNIMIEFPTMAKEFQEFYELPEPVIPGVILSTSDVGDCSITARSCWRIRHSLVTQDVYKRIHRGSISLSKVVDDINKSVFSNYRRLPTRLCELLAIDVSAPVECMTLAFDELNAQDAICNRNKEKISEFLATEINPGMRYTAYDLATSLMDLGGRIEGLSAHSQSCLQKLLLRAPYLDWERIAKTTGVVVTA